MREMTWQIDEDGALVLTVPVDPSPNRNLVVLKDAEDVERLLIALAVARSDMRPKIDDRRAAEIADRLRLALRGD